MGDCDAALSVDPNQVEPHVARARGECELGEIDYAVTDCDSAIRLDANCMEAYVIRAKARLEKFSEMRTLAEVAECIQAADDCQKALELSKKFKGDMEGMSRARSIRGLAHELRGQIYHNLWVTKRALENMGRRFPWTPISSARAATGHHAIGMEDFTGALNDCNTAVSLDMPGPTLMRVAA